MYLGYTDFWFADRMGAHSIGRPHVSEDLFSGTNFMGVSVQLTAFGVYVPVLNEWWLNFDTSSQTWCYNLGHKSWMRQDYGDGQMVYTDGKNSSDNLQTWTVLAAKASSTPVEVKSSNRGVSNVNALYATTGEIELEQPDNRLTVIGVSIVYVNETGSGRVVTIQKSVDGADWEAYGTLVIEAPPSVVPQGVGLSNDVPTRVGTVDGTIEGNTVRFRVFFDPDDSPTHLKLVRFSVYAIKGAPTFQG
jgi:hypothetical protein